MVIVEYIIGIYGCGRQTMTDEYQVTPFIVNLCVK